MHCWKCILQLRCYIEVPFGALLGKKVLLTNLSTRITKNWVIHKSCEGEHVPHKGVESMEHTPG